MNPIEQRELEFEHECRIRDYYATNLKTQRPQELLVGTEYSFSEGSTRADMVTIDESELILVWEFKIKADFDALGQIQCYVALARQKYNFKRPVRGVIAAFNFRSEVSQTIEILNLNIEKVIIPAWMRQAGNIPLTQGESPMIVEIPDLTKSSN